VDRFFVDTVVFEQASLRLLVDVLGADQIMLGSDYPYPLGERPAGQVIRSATFLTDEQANKLLSGNAMRFLGRG
jgi:aminocarboxymuconate-semialdehyde decarboxylase